MTRYEYSALVGIKPLPRDDDSDSDDDDNEEEEGEQEEGKKDKDDCGSVRGQQHSGGRPKSRIFFFDEGHPLCKSHCQYLKSKHPTTIVNGQFCRFC